MTTQSAMSPSLPTRGSVSNTTPISGIGFIAICLVAALVVVSAVSAAILLAGHHAAWSKPLIACGLITALASGISLLLLWRGMMGGVQELVGAAMLAMGARLLISAGGVLVAILAFRLAGLPTLILIIPFYLTQIVAEVVGLSRAMRTSKVSQ